jgi:iron complex transport system permease protein
MLKDEGQQHYREGPADKTEALQSHTSPAALWVALILLLAGLFVMDLSLGSVNIPLPSILGMLIGKQPEQQAWFKILHLFRLPKAITAVFAGASLAMSGLQMQTLFRNPLAGPFVLGINSGASLGVALVILGTGTVSQTALFAGLGFLGDVGLIIAAGLGASSVLVFVLLVSRRVQNVMTLLILGLLFGYATSAVVSILLHFSIAERIHLFISWTFGSFGGVSYKQLRVMVPVLCLALLISFLSVKPLNALLLGENYARSMGLSVRRARLLIIGSTALLAGSVTAFCGPIAFIGVAIPHLGRSLFNTSDHRVLMPAVILLGALTAVFADILSGLPGSQVVLPLNAVTSLIGAPVVAWIILSRRNLRRTFAS